MTKKLSKHATHKPAELSFANENYRRFLLYLDHLKKCTNSIEAHFAQRFSVKGVHLFWLYELCRYPEGLTSVELATLCNVNRSLVSREMPLLLEKGLVCHKEAQEPKKYNRLFCLTAEGQALAKELMEVASELQATAGTGVSPEDMATFRQVLQTLSINFEKIMTESPIFSAERKQK